MIDLILIVLFCWLFFKAVGLAFKVAWGGLKIVATILFAIAVPLLAVCLIFAGGVILLVPVGLIALAFWLLTKCV